jgi:RHS repeat-associated protein
MEKNCAALNGAAGACVWSDAGIRYELLSANQYFYGGTTPIWPTSAIVDPFDNRITVTYVPSTFGAISAITDTYQRDITFSYSTGTNEIQRRLDRITYNAKSYVYEHTLYTPSQTGGTGRLALPSPGRKFLTSVSPPAGPGYSYAYGYSDTVAANQYALKTATYPNGGTINYTYASANFFTGHETVPFSVVTKRITGGRDVVSGTWTYSYVSPSTSAKHVTTVGRPDGFSDTYTLYGFGYVKSLNATGSAWLVGLPQEIARGSRSEVDTYTWEAAIATISDAFYSAAVYSASACTALVHDAGVKVPQLKERRVSRDLATFTTANSNFDAFAQPRTVTETGQQSVGTQTRTTTWTYFSMPTDTSGATLNLLRGRPATQRVCVGTDCYSNSWSYNASGFAKDSEELAGVKTTFAYGTDGNLSKLTNELGKALTLSGYLTGHGLPATLNFNGAFSITQTAYSEGWLKSRTNGRGKTTAYEYDAAGRLTKITPPGINSITNFSYATDGSSVTETRGTYSKTTTVDGFGRMSGTSESTGTLTKTRYDAMGRASFRSYPYNASSSEVGQLVVYDGLGREKTVKNGYRWSTAQCDVAAACQVDKSYSSNCVTETAARASSDSITSVSCSASFGDPNEAPIRKVTDGELRVWQYTYNAHGDLKNITAPLTKGNRSATYFAATQFLETETSAEGGTVTYGRNAIGQMTSRRDARNITVSHGYSDALSRLRSISYGTGSPDNVTLDYDDENNVTSRSSTNGGAFTFAYDDLNRMVSQTWSFGGRTYTTSYDYNSAGCLTSLGYPTRATLIMTCDSANRVTSIKSGADTIVSSITYHPSGAVKTMTYGNGKGTTIVYDDRGRAEEITSAGVVDLRYGYDGTNNVKSFNNLAAPNSARTMTYDKSGQLLTSIAPSLWGTAAYDYDDVGNRTLRSVGSMTNSFAYGTDNRLASMSGPTVFHGEMVLTWDAAGRLASTSNGETYRYDGRGRRVQKSSAAQTIVYHYDWTGRVIAESAPDGTALREYIYLGGQLVAVEGCIDDSAVCGRQWYHTDVLGSVVARTDATGVVVSRLDYEPWGEQWTAIGDVGSRRFNGQSLDTETGFYNFGGRLYWPGIGRFISIDEAAPNPNAPESFNRYAYVYNNPHKYTDPDGQVPFLVVTAGVGAAAGGIWGLYTSYRDLGHIDWGRAGKYALVGGAIGLGAGAGTAFALTGSATASVAEVGIAGASFLGIGGATAEKGVEGGQKLLNTARGNLLTSASDSKLRNIINYLYRPNARIGSGSTADVIRHELTTGELLSKSGHFQKGVESREALSRLLDSARLSPGDRQIAEGLLLDLQKALSGQ